MEQWAYFDEKYGAPCGSGAQCRVYRRGDLAVKVLTPGHQLADVMREGYALALVENLGIPISKLQGVYRERGFLVMEMQYVAGRELMDEIFACHGRGDAAAVRGHLEAMVDMQVRMHAARIHGLESARRIYRALFQDSHWAGFPHAEKYRALTETLPDGESLCHNDYHPRNVLYDGQTYTVIDWDSASVGDPAGDLAHTYLVTMLSDKNLADDYVRMYIDKTGFDRARMEPWLPLHAAILYATLIAKEKNAPYCEALKPFLL